MKKNRKIIWVFTTLLIISSMLLVACKTEEAAAPAEEEEAEGVEEAEEAPVEKKKVVIFIGMGTGTDPDQVAAQEELQEEFNSTHDAIEVEFLIVPHEEAQTRYLSMLSGGNAPQLVGPNGISTVAQFFDTWEDVEPYIEAENLDLSDFYGPAVELNAYPDKVVGLPLGLFPSFVFYNKDHFDAAGLDYPTHDYEDTSWTMAELREYAIQLTLDENGNTPASDDFDPANIVQWGYDDSWISTRGYLAGWGAENVGRPTTADYKTAVTNSEEWVYGLQWLSDGIWVDYFIPDYAGQDAYYAVGGDPFGGGMVSMFTSHTWFFPEGLVELPFEYDIAPLPYNHKGTRVSRIHADTFTIPAEAENKEAAWEVLKWLTSADQIVDVCMIYGCIPARKSVQEQFTQRLEENYPGLDYDVMWGSIEYLDDPNHECWVPEWGRVEDTMNAVLDQVYSGSETDAQKLLDDANEDIQAILDEYWEGQ